MNCKEIIEKHTTFLSEGFVCDRLEGDQVLVVTPYQLPDGDLIELVVEERPNGRVRVRDVGETMSSLISQGFDPHASEKRKWLLRQAVSGSGVEFYTGELRKEGAEADVGALVLDVAAAARAVADLVYLHRSQEPQDFESRVVTFLSDHAKSVEPRVRVKGESGHVYRLTARVIRPDSPSLLITALAPRARSQVKGAVDRTVRQWVDINHNVPSGEKVSFLNDATGLWAPADLRLLSRFSVVAGWRTRHRLTPLLEGKILEADIDLDLRLWEEPGPTSEDEN